MASIERSEGVEICRSGLIQAPFSYLKMIFIDRKMDDEKMEFVLTHELSHIIHNHYIDHIVLYMLSSRGSTPSSGSFVVRYWRCTNSKPTARFSGASSTPRGIDGC
ncbi:MAG: ImmA/IrrE family metallo-endopeptidase [Rikenellaceae bacterium]